MAHKASLRAKKIAEEGQSITKKLSSRLNKKSAVGNENTFDNMPILNASGTKYEIVRKVASAMGMLVTEDETADWDLKWADSPGTLEKYSELKSYQRINHFPGMGEIARKDSLARNLQKIKKIHPHEFSFFPSTWILPAEYISLKSSIIEQQKRKKTLKTFIVKPPNSSQGNGIYLLQSPAQLREGESVVVQEYIAKPLLIDGLKFDLRIYVLVLSCDPLKIYLYRDGLVRLSTKPYQPPTVENLHESFMHLTNYSINKHSDTFTQEEGIDRGSKRTMKWFNTWLADNGYNHVEMWDRIADVIIKTIIVSHPHVVHSYQICRPGLTAGNDRNGFFEVLGFDIILDDSLKPWLLEVNRSPSFNSDSKLDRDIKSGVIYDALKLADIRFNGRQNHKRCQRTASRQRLLSGNSRSQTFSGGWSVPQSETPSTINTGRFYEAQRKITEIKQRLDEIAWEKERVEYEATHMGSYSCIYPPKDTVRDCLYSKLLDTANKIALAGTQSLRRKSSSQNLQKLKEHELLELLTQFEVESYHSCQRKAPLPTKTDSLTSLIIDDDQSHVAHTRVKEEERIQLAMIALGKATPMISGCFKEEVVKTVNEVRTDWKVHQSNVATFWLLVCNKEKRKEIIQRVFEQVKDIMIHQWHKGKLDSVRLYHFVKKLKSFLLAKGGQGLWSCFSGTSWEKAFKTSVDVMSITEFECCKRMVRLCQDSILAHYYLTDCQTGKNSKKMSSGSCVSLKTASIPQRSLHMPKATSSHPSISLPAI